MKEVYNYAKKEAIKSVFNSSISNLVYFFPNKLKF